MRLNLWKISIPPAPEGERMANVLERKAWSRGKPDANSKVPQKQKEKYLHPDAVIWVVKSSSLKRIQDAVILFSHCTHFPYLGRKKRLQNQGSSAEAAVPPRSLGTFEMMFSEAAANLACTTGLCVWSCGGKCRGGIASVESCGVPDGGFLSRGISSRMLESAWTVCVHMDLQLTRACSAPLMHPGHTSHPAHPQSISAVGTQELWRSLTARVWLYPELLSSGTAKSARSEPPKTGFSVPTPLVLWKLHVVDEGFIQCNAEHFKSMWNWEAVSLGWVEWYELQIILF